MPEAYTGEAEQSEPVAVSARQDAAPSGVPFQTLVPHAHRLLALQRSAGNRAVGGLLAREPLAGGQAGRRTLQRLETNEQRSTRLDAEIDRAIAAGDWGEAAKSLNGFNDDDIAKRVGSDARLTGNRRQLMAGALKTMILWPPPQRVADAIYNADGPAARLGRIDFIKDAAARGDWRGAVLALNGLSDDDIDTTLADELPAGSTVQLWDAANVWMRSWKDHVEAGFRRIDPPFRNPAIKFAYRMNRATGSVGQLKALWILDPPETGPWTKLTWDSIAGTAADRIYHPENIDQGQLGLCGPAAALNADAEQNAPAYARLVVEIFALGRADGEKINQRLLGGSPVAATRMDPCDWMILSAMQDVLNSWYDYYGEHVAPPAEDKRAGLYNWQEKHALARFGHCVETDTWDDANAAYKVDYLLNNRPDDVIVVMCVDANVLQNLPPAGHQNHFIRVLSWVRHVGGNVLFDYFTWGAKQTYNQPIATFNKLWYGYVVGSKVPGLLKAAEKAGP
jgi:hypothetical protein